MSRELVNWVQEDNIAVVTINNPPMNVLSGKVAIELMECLEEINNNEGCRALVLTGAGDKAFMAGADIKEFPQMIGVPGATYPFTKRLHSVLLYLENMPIPTIAALNGYTLGGGLELALAFDIRIASEKALLGLPEIKLALFPGGGGTQRLPRLVGLSRAKEIMFSGEPISAAEALRIGLVNKVVPHDEVLQASKDYAKQLTNRAAVALSLIKEAVNRGMKMTLEEGLKVEMDLFDRVFQTEDVKEGVQAFIEKREPKLKHC